MDGEKLNLITISIIDPNSLNLKVYPQSKRNNLSNAMECQNFIDIETVLVVFRFELIK